MSTFILPENPVKPQQPLSETQQPVVEPHQPVVEPQQPVVEPQQPLGEFRPPPVVESNNSGKITATYCS